MKTKAISPLISYILLIGMVIATSVMVSTYLIKQSKSINFESKEIEIYCSDVAADAVIERCIIDTTRNSIMVLFLNITNRGYYNISNLGVARKDTNLKNLIPKDEFNYQLYNKDGSYDSASPPIPSIGPGRKVKFQLVVNQNPTTTKITITPSMSVEDKQAVCNEKAFIVEFDTRLCT